MSLYRHGKVRSSRDQIDRRRVRKGALSVHTFIAAIIVLPGIAFGQAGSLQQELTIQPIPEDMPALEMPEREAMPASPTFEVPEAFRDKPDSGRPIPTARTITYAKRPATDPDLTTLDIYANRGLFPKPVIVYFHGGRWRGGDKADVKRSAELLGQQGFVFVSANYRLAPRARHPAPLDDAVAALAWVRKKIDRYGGDRNRLTIVGEQAGAQIVARLIIDPPRMRKASLAASNVQKVVLINGDAYDIRLRFDHPLEDRTMPLRSSRVDLKLAFGSGRLWDDASAAIIGLRSLAQRE
ncbi:MAG: alpha/beta hydrolase, partial [Pseudomonadota bacterium]